jgi:hypothetical protein
MNYKATASGANATTRTTKLELKQTEQGDVVIAGSLWSSDWMNSRF